MIIEIRGTGTQNKGAELMLCAIQQYFGERIREAKFAVDPFFGPYAARAKYGLLSKVRSHGFGRARIAQAFMSARFRESYGLVADSEIAAVLDASGFAFGDPWGPGPSDWLAKQATAWKRRGTKVILLPQAFGPFENERVRSSFRRALEKLTLVFARDRASYEYVQDLGGPFPQVKQAPDFTNIVQGQFPAELDLPPRFACIVPNARMLDKAALAERESYVTFLAFAARELRRNHVQPLLICHESKDDEALVQLVQQEFAEPLATLAEEDPIRLKGIEQRAVAVIGSRFHALLGALSQAVPAVGTSWSHKYEALFDDYDCREYLVATNVDSDYLGALIERLCDADHQTALRNLLRSRAQILRAQVNAMFENVAQVLTA